MAHCALKSVSENSDFMGSARAPLAAGSALSPGRNRAAYGLTLGFLACARFFFFAARRREEHAGRVRSPFSDTL